MRVLGDEGKLERGCYGPGTDLRKVSMACPRHPTPYLRFMVKRLSLAHVFIALAAVALRVIQQVATQACRRALASRQITAESLTALFLLLGCREEHHRGPHRQASSSRHGAGAGWNLAVGLCLCFLNLLLLRS